MPQGSLSEISSLSCSTGLSVSESNLVRHQEQGFLMMVDAHFVFYFQDVHSIFPSPQLYGQSSSTAVGRMGHSTCLYKK